jgi:hypothetical protein
MSADLQLLRAEVEEVYAPGEAALSVKASVLRIIDRHMYAAETEICEECGGRGRYVGWPHTTCPACGGLGRKPLGG